MKKEPVNAEINSVLAVILGEHLFVGNSPDDFADRVVKIPKNTDLRDEIAPTRIGFVKEKYN